MTALYIPGQLKLEGRGQSQRLLIVVLGQAIINLQALWHNGHPHFLMINVLKLYCSYVLGQLRTGGELLDRILERLNVGLCNTETSCLSLNKSTT